MNKGDYEHEIVKFDWSIYSGPDYYEPKNVPLALLELINLENEEDNNAVYNSVLSAVGNNHGGTYYPVIERAIKYIIGTALGSEFEVARNCSLNMLIDLYATFDAEICKYTKITFEDLEKVVSNEIEEIKPELISILNYSKESSRNKELASDLLACIDEID